MTDAKAVPAGCLMAFTLVELLVTLALLVTLIAILLPSLASARAIARTGVCASNLHQMGVAMVAYKINERTYPASYTRWAAIDLRGLPGPGAVWPAQLRKYAGGLGSEGMFYCPEAPETSKWVPKFGSTNPGRYGYGEGERYVPGHVSLGNSYGHNNDGTRTHARKSGCGTGLGMTDDPDGIPLPVRCVRQPSGFLCFADSRLDNLWDAFIDFRVFGEDLAERHYLGQCNFLYGDGHVESVADPKSFEDNSGIGLVDPAKAQQWNHDGKYP